MWYMFYFLQIRKNCVSILPQFGESCEEIHLYTYLLQAHKAKDRTAFVFCTELKTMSVLSFILAAQRMRSRINKTQDL